MGDRHRLLIVDDQPGNIRVMAEALRHDYELRFATGGIAALHLIADGAVDLVLLDVEMPDLDGFEVCRRIKADPRTAGIPVIFVTAIGEAEVEARGFDLGGVDYITKPIQPPIVRARVRTHLELEASRDQLRRQALDLERQNEILQENARLKDDVERISRHDLKTPLSSIIGLSQLLAEEPGIAPARLAMLRTISQAGFRLMEMVNRSLDLYRMERGTYRLEAAAIDVRALAGKVALDLQSLIQGKGLRLAMSSEGFGADDPLALGEEPLCYALFANLIKNAAEASPPGTLSVAFAPENGAVAIRIHNMGAVAESLRSRFFEKYATDGKRAGTGLGTYSARLMAETQGGSIELAATATATTITVRLPAAPPRVAAAPALQTGDGATLPAAAEWPPRRILLVDDDEDSRRVLAAMLEHPRWTLDEAADGAGALEKLASGTYDCVLLDLELPDLHGLELVEKLCAGEPTARPAVLVVLSAHAGSEMRDRALAAGCDCYLEKPPRREELIGVILGPPGARETGDELTENEVAIDAELAPLIPQFVLRKADEIGGMRSALEVGDTDAVRRTSHRLKGSLQMYGFERAAGFCDEIERLAGGDERTDLARCLAVLERHWKSVERRHGPRGR